MLLCAGTCDFRRKKKTIQYINHILHTDLHKDTTRDEYKRAIDQIEAHEQIGSIRN